MSELCTPLHELFALRGASARTGLCGPDNRREPYQLLANPVHALLSKRADAVAVALRRTAFQATRAGGFALAAEPECLRNSVEDPGFQGQARLANAAATAFLVTPRHVITARHFLNSGGVTNLGFAFGYRASPQWAAEATRNPPPYQFDADHVRFGKKLVPVRVHAANDIALIELDREVLPPIAEPIPLAPPDSIQLRQQIAMIGHPRRLPCKVVAGIPPELPWPLIYGFDDRHVMTDVDSFQGNSGSPLLNLAGEVFAVKVRDDEVADEIPGTCIAARATRPGNAIATRLESLANLLTALV